jgi:hypothetical protein
MTNGQKMEAIVLPKKLGFRIIAMTSKATPIGYKNRSTTYSNGLP